jgi:uncharacterized protein (TIGR03067 family)
MKMLGLASFAACLAVAFTVQAGDEAALKKERAALQGVWKITSFETPDGKKDDLNGATLEFDKDGKNLTFTKDGDTKKGTFKINPAGKPKEIDISPSDENKTMAGIYLLEKTTLKICLATGANDARPTEFAVKDGSKAVLITLEKAK